MISRHDTNFTELEDDDVISTTVIVFYFPRTPGPGPYDWPAPILQYMSDRGPLH